jgi:8-oxo-dGTP pyrophosphatase MutT (NUDIX family)
MSPITLADVSRALALPGFDWQAAQAAQLRMAPRPRPIRGPDRPGVPRQAGVLLLLYPVQGDLTFALMQRPEYDGVHSGQISLPGGRREGDESLSHTALRETCEELGVCDGLTLLGSLEKLYIPPSDFEVSPVVAYRAERPTWRPDPAEVAAIIETPLSVLFDDTLKDSEEVFRADVNLTLTIYFYRIQGHKVWGATAAILSEFEVRLRAALTL